MACKEIEFGTDEATAVAVAAARRSTARENRIADALDRIAEGEPPEAIPKVFHGHLLLEYPIDSHTSIYYRESRNLVTVVYIGIPQK